MSRPFEAICPFCGHRHQRTTAITPAGDHVTTEPRMMPGDATMCIRCGEFAVCGDDRKLRTPTTDEAALLDATPTVRMIREAWTAMMPKQ